MFLRLVDAYIVPLGARGFLMCVVVWRVAEAQKRCLGGGHDQGDCRQRANVTIFKKELP